MRYLYEGCRYPFPHRITGDGYQRLMHGPLQENEPSPQHPFVWTPGVAAARALCKRLASEGRLLVPSSRHNDQGRQQTAEIVRRYWGKLPKGQIAKLAGCSTSSVYDWSVRLGLQKREVGPEVTSFIRENLGHMSMRDMARELGLGDALVVILVRKIREEQEHGHIQRNSA